MNDSPPLCRNLGKPGCLATANPNHAMHFDDIGKPPIRWCSACGPEAHQINDSINHALRTRPEFFKQLESAIESHLPANSNPNN